MCFCASLGVCMYEYSMVFHLNCLTIDTSSKHFNFVYYHQYFSHTVIIPFAVSVRCMNSTLSMSKI